MANSASHIFSGIDLFQNKDLFSTPEKTKFKNAVCIAVDTYHSRFDYYAMENGDKSTIVHKNKEYTAQLYSPEFLNELTEAVRSFTSLRSTMEDTSVTLVLPDSAVSMDTVNIPNINRRRNDEAINATVSGLYKNQDDLFINRYLASQSKQVVTYTLSVANAPLIKALAGAMQDGGMKPTCITYSANAVSNAIAQLCPKLKASSYLVLDIKHHTTVISFVSKGRTTGFYDLPFGYSILRKNKVQSEDMLFDHPVAELAVLNAREKARAKQLTMMGGEENENGEDLENEDGKFGSEEGSTVDPTSGTTAVTIKTLPKKTPRKLPKFMLRPEPTDDEGYSYENFRVFMKWALTLIDGNPRLTAQGEPEAVYVNMPSDLDFLYEMANAEKEENKIEFIPLEFNGDRDEISDNLELYGALFAPSQNRMNNFVVD